MKSSSRESKESMALSYYMLEFLSVSPSSLSWIHDLILATIFQVRKLLCNLVIFPFSNCYLLCILFLFVQFFFSLFYWQIKFGNTTCVSVIVVPAKSLVAQLVGISWCFQWRHLGFKTPHPPPTVELSKSVIVLTFILFFQKLDWNIYVCFRSHAGWRWYDYRWWSNRSNFE